MGVKGKNIQVGHINNIPYFDQNIVLRRHTPGIVSLGEYSFPPPLCLFSDISTIMGLFFIVYAINHSLCLHSSSTSTTSAPSSPPSSPLLLILILYLL